MSKQCVICGDEDTENQLLLQAPCGNHWVCPDCVVNFFERATTNESLFPPKCCEQPFMLEEYEEYVPFETAWAYQMKEQGEYAILAKFRIYCANRTCATFLHPSSHVTDPDTNITYAICEDDDCGKLTCCFCRVLLDHGTQNHICQETEEEKKFKETATKEGYQECAICGATVELAEACNHITCECGHEFCYICGKQWPGLHQCPQYGPAEYDEELYNQGGFHRDTGLNREGLTRREVLNGGRRDEEEEEGNEDDDGEQENQDPDWEVLQHIDPAEREIINLLPPEEREDALDNLRIMLLTTQGITFNQGQAPPQAENEQEDGPEEGDENNPENEGGENHDQAEDEALNNEAEEIRAVDNTNLINVDEAAPSQGEEPSDRDPVPDEHAGVGAELLVPLQNDLLVHSATSGAVEGIETLEATNSNPFEEEEGPSRTSASSESDEALPATPMDGIESNEGVKGTGEVEQPVMTQINPPGAWIEDEQF